ncbi:MAG TPA: hypothetical protein VHM20_05270, partial [Gammaproteobacteria bacterium]|nr:hypothetical protein [Gammaproteobacteria bacterium]
MQSQKKLQSSNEQIMSLLKMFYDHPEEIKKINSLFDSVKNLLSKEPQQIALFVAAYQKNFDSIAETVSHHNFNPNHYYEYKYDLYNGVEKIEQHMWGNSILSVILDGKEDHRALQFTKCMIEKGADIFAIDKFSDNFPIKKIIQNKWLDEILPLIEKKVISQKKFDEYIIVRLLINKNVEEIEYEIELLKSHGLISHDVEEIFYHSKRNGCDLKIIYAKFPNALQQFILNMANSDFVTIPDREYFFNILSQIFSSPEISSLAAPHFAKLNWVRFGANGMCSETWSKFAEAVISQSNLHTHHPQLLLKPGKISVKIPDKFFFDSKEWKFENSLGRTLLFKNTHNDILAFKIQKKGESEKELQKEFNTASYLKQHANIIKLQSAIHTPKAIITIPDMK